MLEHHEETHPRVIEPDPQGEEVLGGEPALPHDALQLLAAMQGDHQEQRPAVPLAQQQELLVVRMVPKSARSLELTVTAISLCGP